MPSITINLSWVDTNRVEDGYRVYKSTSPMDPSVSMPAPIATLDPNSESYVDTDVTYGQTYYYIVSAYNNLQSEEVFSENKEVVCEENIYAISVSGETHKIDTNGNRIFVDRTQNLFGTIRQGFTMDMDFKGNFYYVSGNTIKKVDKNFQDVWTYDFAPYSIYGNHFAFYVGVDECVYCINTYHQNNNSKLYIFKINKDGTQGEVYEDSIGTQFSYPSITLSPDMSKLVIQYTYSTTTYTRIIDILTEKNYSYNIGSYLNRTLEPQRSIYIDSNNNIYSGGAERVSSCDQYGQERWRTDNSIFDNTYGSVLSMDETALYTVVDDKNRIYKMNTSNGSITNNTFQYGINDLCIDSNDNVYVATAYSNDGTIRKYDSNLSPQWTYDTLSTGFDYIIIEPGMHYQAVHKGLGDE